MGLSEFILARVLPFAMTMLIAPGVSAMDMEQWKFPIPTSSPSASDSLTLDMALHKIAQTNGLLKSVDERKAGLSGMIDQSRVWPNPGFGFEVEEFGGSLPGFSESGLSFSLSQEFELWGKRKARRKAAEVEAKAIRLEADISAFDIYSEAGFRFYELIHAQERLLLIRKAEELTRNMVDITRLRVEKGASLVSEHHMAELELARNKVELNEAEMELNNAKRNLAALWNGTAEEIRAVSDQSQPIDLPDLDYLIGLADGSREIVTIDAQQEMIGAMIQSARTEVRPSLELSTGLKHLPADNVSTFMVGIALPLPLFNRNRGQLSYLHSQAGAIEYEKAQALTLTEMEIINIHERARQLRVMLENLKQEVIPKAEETFAALGDAYQKGKLPYLTMLEGERMLLDLQHDRNDAVLEFQHQIVALENILGVMLHKPLETIGDR